MTRIILFLLGLCLTLPCLATDTFATNRSHSPHPRVVEAGTINLRDFGAVGDGVANDGPALQKALDALAAAGGGTLFIPEGKYAIATPVIKDFTGLALSLTIIGVESLTPVAPPTAPGSELSKGLDLLSEIYPRTGDTGDAITLVGLQSLIVKDVAFVGTEGVTTDAVVTLLLTDIEKVQIKHSEFYGLATLVGGGAIVKAVRSNLEITQSKFLGSVATSGWYVPVVENMEWRGITVSDTTFLDYGQRAFFSKSGLAAPISWINIGNAAPPDNHSPRREVVLRNVFLDEGGYWGLSSLPYRYAPQSAPIDLIYITGLGMNVSNFGQYGHLLYDAQRVFIEKSNYGWSHNATAAIGLINVKTAILDKLNCVAAADHIYADSTSKELTVINSTYSQLDSFAEKTNTINTTTDENDPVQYVRQRFAAVLGREPDPAAHFYWSDLLIHCFDDSVCQASTKEALNNYLSSSSSPVFAISGRIIDEQGSALSGVIVTLSGSQSVTTKTDDSGNYSFTNLPTSGNYLITPSKTHYNFDSANETFITPGGDRTANFTARLNTHVIKGTVRSEGIPLPGVTVAVSGSATGTAITDSEGEYSFVLNEDGNYTITPTKAHYTIAPGTSSISNLSTDTQFDFTATLQKHSITGTVRSEGNPLPGVTVAVSGSASATAITDSAGEYSFVLNADGNYTVTTTKAHYTFDSGISSISNLSTDTQFDFTATLQKHSITGMVRSEGNPLPGVTVAVYGSATATAITNSAGEYSFVLNAGGNYTVTTTKAHYTFDAGTNSISNFSTDTQFDFTATLQKHSITGHVLNPDGSPISGVVMTLSGSITRTTTTASDGSYSFPNIDGGASFTVTASKDGYLMSPPIQIFNDLAADTVAVFRARQLPLLLTVLNSDRAVALELTQQVPEPFSLTTTLLTDGRNRTRIMLFGTTLGLLPGEGVEAVTAEAEDAKHVRYPLRVEFLTALPELPGVTQIVIRLNGDLAGAGDVLVSVTVHGLTSNKVRIAIEN